MKIGKIKLSQEKLIIAVVLTIVAIVLAIYIVFFAPLVAKLKTELEYLTKLKHIGGHVVKRLYEVYRHITGDKSHLCNKCGRVINNVFKRVKDYYIKNYK